MGCIRKEDALERLALIKEECMAANKRVCAGTVQQAMDAVSRIKEFEIVPTRIEPETSEIIVSLEPYFPGGQIGRDVHRCRFCQTQVDKHDRFCKFCGKKFINQKGEQKK